MLPSTITRGIFLAIAALVCAGAVDGTLRAADDERPTLTVKPTEDFAVTGDGASPAWERADWVMLRKREPAGPLPYEARFKVLYSPTGLYFLIDGTDAELTATLRKDYAHLWEEDAFEVLLWPDERNVVYLEYQISPLNYELILLIPYLAGDTSRGWRPWEYEGERRTRKATRAIGGMKVSGAKITGWRAEFFLPYALFAPLQNVPPKPGTTWRANVYRLDSDNGQPTRWLWAPLTGRFHQPDKFGTLVFE